MVGSSAVNHKLQTSLKAQRDEGEAAAQVALTTLSQVGANSYSSRGAEDWI